MKKYDDCRYGHCGYPYGDNFDKNNVECLYSGKRKLTPAGIVITMTVEI